MPPGEFNPFIVYLAPLSAWDCRHAGSNSGDRRGRG